jgi:hypothetical protein
MRKALLLAVAAALAVAGLAYAASNNAYTVTASIKPTKSGTKKHPRTVSQNFTYNIKSLTPGAIPANVKTYRTVVQGIHENTNKFPACGTSRLNSATQGPSTCPRGSKVGSGFARVLDSLTSQPQRTDASGIEPCRLNITIYNGGNHTLSFYFTKGTCTNLPHSIAIAGTLKSFRGGYRDVYTIPNFLRSPKAGHRFTIVRLHTAIGVHNRTVRVHGKKKTFGLFYSYLCPPNHFRQVRVTFKAVDGSSQTATRNVACS